MSANVKQLRARPSSAIYPATEAELRVQLAACYRLVAHFGMDDLIYNHISARLPGPEHHFLINPYGVLFSEVTASCLVKIDLDGNQIEPGEYEVNRAGFVIHSAIHAARADAMCVLHTHPEAGTAISALPEGLLPLSQFAMRYQGHMGFHDYEGVALDTGERERLVRDIGPHQTLVMRNHGILTTGRTVPEAFILMYYFERAAQVQLRAQAALRQVDAPAQSRALVLPKPAVTELAARQFTEYAGDILPAGTREWPAFIRLLDRICPDYRS
jgi:ribulose-5-phosphate 4-epimerase/fuculose-1-phosphate aldolase